MVKRVVARPLYARPGYSRTVTANPTVDSIQKRETSRERVERDPPTISRIGGSPASLGTGTVELQNLLNLADQLKPKDRKELLDRLALQHGLEVAPTASDRDLNMWSEAVHCALEESLGGEMGAGVGVLAIRRLVGARSAWAPVSEFMRTSKLSDLTVMERQSCYGMLAKLLVDHARYVARQSGAPLGPKLVSPCAGSIRGIVDRAFPGYLAAGLLHVIANPKRLSS